VPTATQPSWGVQGTAPRGTPTRTPRGRLERPGPVADSHRAGLAPAALRWFTPAASPGRATRINPPQAAINQRRRIG